MTVTISYSLASLLSLDLSAGPSTVATDVAALAGGGFVGVGSFNGHTALDFFDGGGVHTGGFGTLDGVSAAVVPLENGNIVVASLSGPGTYVIRTLAGGIVQGDTAIEGSEFEAVQIDAASLGGNDFVLAVCLQQGRFTINVRRVIDGVVSTAGVLNGQTSIPSDPSVAAFENGDVLVTFTHDTGLGADLWMGFWRQGSSQFDQIIVADGRGTFSRNPSVVDLPGAGFGIAYETDSQSDSLDVVFSLFSDTGTRLATFDISNPSFVSHRSDESNATASMLTDTLVAITYTARSTATRDEPPVSKVALFDLTTNTTVARLSISSLTLIRSTGPLVAGLEDGHLAFFATNTSSGSDGFGQLLGAVRTQIGDAAADLMTGDEVRDIMLGGDGNDTMIGGLGAANDLHGGLGADRFHFGGGQIAAGTVIAGDGGADRIDVTGVAGLDLAIITSIEKLAFAGGGDLSVQLAAGQFGTGQLSASLQVIGQSGDRNRVLIDMGADTALDLSRLTFSTWVDSGTEADRVEITGDGDAEAVRGSGRADVIDLGGGDDTLNGGLGRDELTGGAGGDRFVFTTVLSGGNVDRVTDFASGSDQLRLDNVVFSGLGRGTLANSAFELGTVATSTKDRIIYDALTGALFFDADGTGVAEQQRMATLTSDTVLLASDVFVF